MKLNLIKVLSLAIFLLPATSIPVPAQDPSEFEEMDGEYVISKTGFHAGLYLGTYFANKYPASLYDGYGYDFEGNKNSFLNSWMYQKIVIQYGGYGNSGLPDYIAEELNVPHEDWNFDESDMPVNMKYKTSIAVGFNGRYSLDGKNAVLINVDGVIVKAAGNFSITTKPPPNSTQINNSIQTFNISGEEQRLLMQVGYQHIMGEGDGISLFVEGGLHAALVKFSKNEIQINNLVIDLVQDYYDPVNGYTFFTGSKPTGIGFGAFAGLGFHIETNSKWNLQLVYNLMLDKINIGYDPKYSINHAIGLRAYFKLKKS